MALKFVGPFKILFPLIIHVYSWRGKKGKTEQWLHRHLDMMKEIVFCLQQPEELGDSNHPSTVRISNCVTGEGKQSLFFLHLPCRFLFSCIFAVQRLEETKQSGSRTLQRLFCFSVLGLIPETSCLPHVCSGGDWVPCQLMWCCPCWGLPPAWQRESDVQVSMSWCFPAAHQCLLWFQEQKLLEPTQFWNVTVFSCVSAW